MNKEVYRSAVTGKFVTKDYADQNPETTVAETINKDEALATLVKEFVEQVTILLK